MVHARVWLGLLAGTVAWAARATTEPSNPPSRPPGPVVAACAAGLTAQAEVPAVAEPDDQKVFAFAVQSLGYPIFTLPSARLDALLAHQGTEYEPRKRFAEEAVAWAELAGWNVDHHDVRKWLNAPGAFGRDWDDVLQWREEGLGPFERHPKDNGFALGLFEDRLNAQLSTLRAFLVAKGTRAFDREFWSMWKSLPLQIGTLRLVTFRTRSTEARAACDRVEAAYAQVGALIEFAQGIKSRKADPTAPVLSGESLVRHVGDAAWRADAASVVKASTVDDERQAIAAAVLQVNTVKDRGRYVFVAEQARTLAEAIDPAPFAATTPALSVYPHPLLNRLAMLAGKTVTLETFDGSSRTARIVRVANWHADQEGTSPELRVLGDDGALEDVPLVDVVTLKVSDADVDYDRVRDAPVQVRAFSLHRWQRLWLPVLLKARYRVTDDMLVHDDQVVEVARELVSLGAPPETARDFVDAFQQLDTAEEAPFERLSALKRFVASRLVAAYAREIGRNDIGRNNREAMHVLAVTLYLGRGMKGWGFDFAKLIREQAGADALRAAMDRTASTEYPELAILNDRDPGVVEAFVKLMEEKGGQELSKELLRFFRVLDIRWKPLVEKLLLGPAPAALAFLPRDPAMLGQQSQQFLIRLGIPDPMPFGDRRDGTALAFFADEIPALLAAMTERNLDQLAAHLDRIAKATIRSTGRAATLEKNVREAAGALRAALLAAPEVPWTALVPNPRQ